MSSLSLNNDSFIVKAGLAKMLKGGVIMDVVNVEQAKVFILCFNHNIAFIHVYADC